MKCPKCGSERVEITGLYWVCRACGALDDSTFEQIMSVCRRCD